MTLNNTPISYDFLSHHFCLWAVCSHKYHSVILVVVTPRWGLLILRSFPVLFWRINSPLVSGHWPFLMCHQSDCLPWSPSVSTCSPFPSLCIYSLHFPLSCASVFRYKPWVRTIILAFQRILIVLTLAIAFCIFPSIRVVFFCKFFS